MLHLGVHITERCDDCRRGPRCANHAACEQHQDARTAANIGVGWAEFVYGQLEPIESVRRPWPAFKGRCARIAARLTAWLAVEAVRQGELAVLCRWRAEMRWNYLNDRFRGRARDLPYQKPSGRGEVYCLPGHGGVVFIHFRTKRKTPRQFTAADYPWDTARKRAVTPGG